ncbi:hypothetical protein DL93DRAFT_2164339 [Clavulina sp. PMI_390]|nr:hypothetical protein DL93DRAFT_2164339 [Clavulina sp. PMI_390]
MTYSLEGAASVNYVLDFFNVLKDGLHPEFDPFLDRTQYMDLTSSNPLGKHTKTTFFPSASEKLSAVVVQENPAGTLGDHQGEADTTTTFFIKRLSNVLRRTTLFHAGEVLSSFTLPSPITSGCQQTTNIAVNQMRDLALWSRQHLYYVYTITAELLSKVDAQTFRALSFDKNMIWVNEHYAVKRFIPAPKPLNAPNILCGFSLQKYNDATKAIERILKTEVPDEYMGYKSQAHRLRMRKASFFRQFDRNITSELTPFLRRAEVTLSATVYIAPLDAIGMGSDIRFHRH